MRGDGLEACVLVVPYTWEIRVAGSQPVDCAMQCTTFIPTSRDQSDWRCDVGTWDKERLVSACTRPEEGAKWGHDGNSEIDVVLPSLVAYSTYTRHGQVI